MPGLSLHKAGANGGGSSRQWLSGDRVAFGVNLTRENQHRLDPTGLYLGLLLRALTGGLQPGSKNEPLAFKKTGLRTNSVKFGREDESDPLIWDGHQRGIETGRVLERVLDAHVKGCVVEVGVFRGGMIAYLQGILLARSHGEEPVSARELWLVDSFQGLPGVDGMQSRNARGKWNSASEQENWAGILSVGEETVYAMMERHRLLEAGNVHALKGYVNDTLPHWPPSRKIAFLRIDVDIYAATYDTLQYLYPRLSYGGAVLFDDVKLPYARAAMDDYRRARSIAEPIRYLPGTVDPMAYWFKCPPPGAHVKEALGVKDVPQTCA